MKKKENKKGLSPALSQGEGAGKSLPLTPFEGGGKETSKDENLLPEMNAGSEHPFLPLNEGEYGFNREGVKHVTNKISTVFNIKKPSAIGFYVPAEGCISGSRAVRACLMIRVFNN